MNALESAASTAKRALSCDCAVVEFGDGTASAGLDPGEAHRLSVPLVVHGRTVGTLHAVNRAGAIDAALAETVAAHVAASLDGGREPLPELDRLAFSADDLSELTPLLEGTLAPLLGEVRVGLMVWDVERRLLQMVRGSFGAPESVTASQVIDFDDRGNVAVVFGLMQAWEDGRPVGDHVVRRRYREAFGIEHLISAPLGDDERPIGLLHVARAGRAFSPADVARCGELLPRVAIAVASTRSRMHLALQRQVEAVLSRQAVAIASGAAGNESLLRGLEELRGLFRASVVAFVAAESEPLVAGAGGEGLVEEARQERHERTSFRRPGGTGDPGAATLFVPVRLGTRRIGTLATFRDRYESFTAEERHGLARMAELIALAWASERYQQQRAALARLEERQRIADDLHDDVAQILFAAQMQLDGLLEQGDVPQDARSRATRARALLIRGDTAIRNVITKLSRPSPTGVADRLYEVVEAIDEDFDVPVHVEISPEAAEAGGRARRAVADTVVKVAREALVNAAKHAGPCRVTVTLDLPAADRLRLRVADTGTGDPARRTAESHGLTSLRRHVRRHGGTLRVTRGRTGGTAVTVSLPV
jgi:signal transduction histidine kinase